MKTSHGSDFYWKTLLSHAALSLRNFSVTEHYRAFWARSLQKTFISFLSHKGAAGLTVQLPQTEILSLLGQEGLAVLFLVLQSVNDEAEAGPICSL